MKIHLATYRMPKDGNSEAEYEDAAYPPISMTREALYFRAAVADGATETSFAGIWAQELVEAYCKRRINPDRLPETLPRVQRRWRARLNSAPLPWYAEQKLREGAFAALLGLRLAGSPNGECGEWQATAVGDTCLVHVRRGNILTSFPIQSAEDFSNRPGLISSLPVQNAGLHEYVGHACGTWRSGDTFLLLTDALAQWFLRVAPPGTRGLRKDALPWHSSKEFSRRIGRLRGKQEIRNDDVTALVIELE